VVVIGRSGTGKTTCSLLRLFATDLIYRLRFYATKYRLNSLKDAIIDFEKLEKIASLRTVFVTASPVLTNEVKKYYLKLQS
jgi:broad-specificity NMP kinase